MEFDKDPNFKPPISYKHLPYRQVTIITGTRQSNEDVQTYCGEEGFRWNTGHKGFLYDDAKYINLNLTSKNISYTPNYAHGVGPRYHVISFEKLRDIIGEVCPV